MASLTLSNLKDLMSALEVEERAELSSVDSGSTYELLTHTTITLPSKSTLDEPSVSPTTAANAILQRNRYRSAKSELGLYILMNYLPPVEDTADWPCAFAQEFDYSSDSEDSETSTADIPAHLDTPEPLPMMQRLKNCISVTPTSRNQISLVITTHHFNDIPTGIRGSVPDRLVSFPNSHPFPRQWISNMESAIIQHHS
ncbi:hypothetical protein PCANC_08324 [Puccinia coronata f. sp. avenae]|uniref:Uncharacterized protein n=1 Tax=Puccinia coronata f. sp. avenae TaxID=200324 RepID=A0A2N5T4K7_9BASI|nr:hypothetical protein PCANC_08324 [Puccinia coronata f. sp. avenae]